MLGAFISVLKAERAAKQQIFDRLQADRAESSDGVKARFRAQIAELDEMVAKVEAARR